MEAMPSNLHLWGSLPTQTAIQEVKKIDFYPVNSIDSSDTIDFVIPKIPKLMLDRVEVLAKIRVLQTDGANPAANNDVSTVSDLSGALWRNVDVSIGGQWRKSHPGYLGLAGGPKQKGGPKSQRFPDIDF